MSKKLLTVTLVISLFLWGCKDAEKAKQFREQAESFGKSHDYDKAREYIEKAIKYEPDTFMVKLDRGSILSYYLDEARECYDSMKWDCAISAYNKVIKIEDADDMYLAVAYNGLSYIYERQNKYDNAIACAENCIVTYRNSGYYFSDRVGSAWVHLGMIHHSMGRFENMFSDFEKAIPYITADSSKANLYINMANVAFDKLKDGQRVLEYAAKALQYDSTKSRPYLYQAVIYKQSKMKEEACEAIHKYRSVSGDMSAKDLKTFCQ